jgi:hypothetical protein
VVEIPATPSFLVLGFTPSEEMAQQEPLLGAVAPVVQFSKRLAARQERTQLEVAARLHAADGSLRYSPPKYLLIALYNFLQLTFAVVGRAIEKQGQKV